MADPLSTSASIIAVLQLSASVVGYINTAVGAPKERKRLREEVRACEYILNQLKDVADDSEEGTAWLETVEALEATDAPLGRLWVSLNTVKSKLHAREGVQKVFSNLKWPFSENEVEKLFTAIEREKALLELALQNNSRKLILEIQKGAAKDRRKLEELVEAFHGHSSQIRDGFTGLKSGIDSIRNEQIEDRAVVYRREVLQWLARVDYAAQQSDYITRRQAGTGHWLLGSVEFTTWVESSGQTLFCPGIPGAGKTILTSIVVEDLTRRFEDNRAVGVAYLYCDFKRHSDQTVEYLLRDLLKQLSHCLPSIPDCVSTLYSKYRKHGKPAPSFSDISTALRAICRLFTKVFLVVDAIDECQTYDSQRSIFLKEIFALQAQHRVNIFATSRFIPDITQMFADSQSLEIRARAEDVQRYLDARISQLPLFVQQRQDLQAEIKCKIVNAVDGMFLLAQLHLDSLVGKRSPKALRAALEKLPSGPHAYIKTYEEALRRIEAQVVDQVELAKQALSWIVCAQRPVTTTEIQHALAVEIGKPELDEENLTGIEDIISACAGMVTADTESDIIRLVHYTTQEFFALKQKEWLPYVHTGITHTCIAYLSFDVFGAGFSNSVEDLEERLRSNPLYDYAAHNWGYHARMAATEPDHHHTAVDLEPPEPRRPQRFVGTYNTTQQILAFLSNENNLSASIQALFATRRWDLLLCDDVPTHFTAMHTAAYFGLGDIVIRLIEQNHDASEWDTYGRTPLWLAARGGHVMVVDILLQTVGVDPESKDSGYGATPLSVAARSGHYETVILLLDEDDVDPMSRNENGSTPLALAAAGGYDAVVELLLDEEGVELMSRDDLGLTPISNAAAGGHENVVKLLLARGADPNSRGWDGQTPLLAAAYNGHESMLKMLLGVDGIDREPKDAADRTPLWWAVERRQEAIVRLLLAQGGIDVNSRDEFGSSPLFEAALYNYQELVEALLAQDNVEPDLKNKFGRTPLSIASEYAGGDTFKLLLGNNAVDPNSADVSGRTPLHYAARRGRVAAVQMLVARTEVEVNARDVMGLTPLWLAAEKASLGVVRTLLAKYGVDINCKDKNGIALLAQLAQLGFRLSAGPSSDLKTRIAMLLLEKEGVDVNCRSSTGRAPLHYAAEEGNLTVAKLLLKKHGVDVNLRDDEGRTPLSRAAERGYEAIVTELQKAGGIDLDLKSDSSRTAPLRLTEPPLPYPRGNTHDEAISDLPPQGLAKVDAKDKGSKAPPTGADNSGWSIENAWLMQRGVIPFPSMITVGRR